MPFVQPSARESAGAFSPRALAALAAFGLTCADLHPASTARRAELQTASRLAARIDAALQPGHILLLTGPTGSGKSTLLAALARRLRRRGDWVRRPAITSPASGRVIDRIGDSSSLELHDDLRALARVGLADARLAVAPLRSLSRGELERFTLARAIAAVPPGQPATLIIDEFAAHLDDTAASRLAASAARMIRATPGLRAVVATHRHATHAALRPDQSLNLPLHPPEVPNA